MSAFATVKTIVQNASNPIEAMTAIVPLLQSMPPAPVVTGALTRIIRDAIRDEILAREVPIPFVAALEASGKFSADEIAKTYRYAIELGLG